MSTVEDAVREIVYKPGAVHRFDGNGELALAYSRDDTHHYLGISRLKTHPTDIIVLSAMNVLITEFKVDATDIERKRDAKDKRKIVRLSWPIRSRAKQLEIDFSQNEPP
jgi:hypothetical protein